MSSPLTALLSRTVRLSTRAGGTHLMRLFLGVLVLLTLMSTAAMSAMFGAAGLRLLSSLVWWSAAFITLAGIGLFCSAITEEKEEQTIGLLRMAGLRPFAILLAKASARFYDALMLFAVLLPFAMLAVTLGGVSVIQVLACAVALGAYIFLLVNLGLLLSVLRPTTQAASGVMALVLIITQLLPWLFWAYAPLAWLRESTVWHSLSQILATGYGGGLFSFQSASSVVAGLLMFGLSWLCFDRFVRDDEAQAPERMNVRSTSRLRWFGVARPPSGLRAVIWKDFHFGCGGRLMILIKPLLMIALVAVVILIGNSMGGRFDELQAYGITTQIVALLWLVFEFAIHLSRLFAQEVRWQTLTGLLSLPFSARDLAYAKLRAALLAMLPALALLGVGIFLAPADFFDGAGKTLTNWSGWAVLTTVVFFWHACAWLSLVIRRSPLIAAIGLVIGMWFVFGIVSSLFFFLAMSMGGNQGAMGIMQTFLILVYAVPTVLMHAQIARRMRLKGAQ